MGNRTEWTDQEIAHYVENNWGSLTIAARWMNSDHKGEREPVSRQNLQTWVNNSQPAVGIGDSTATIQRIGR